MRNLARVTTLAVIAAFGMATSASAADHRLPVENGPLEVDAADCGFPIDVEVLRDQEYYVQVREGADGSTTFRVTGQLIESFTNEDTGKTIVRKVGGPGWFTLTADGGLFDSQGATWSYLSPAEQAVTGLPGLVFAYGHIRASVDPDFNITSLQSSGRWEDGCALLG